MLDITIRKQTQITYIRLEPSYKQLEVTTIPTPFPCGNRNEHGTQIVQTHNKTTQQNIQFSLNDIFIFTNQHCKKENCWLSCLGSLVFMLPKIVWLSNLFALSVPDEVYSRNASCSLNLISRCRVHLI